MDDLSTPRFHGWKKTRLAAAVLVVAIFATGAMLVGWMTVKAAHEMRADLLQQAQLVAQAVNIERIQSLSGTEADLNNPVYLRLKEQLAAVRSAMPQCRFIYLMGRRVDPPAPSELSAEGSGQTDTAQTPGVIFFFVDSEPADSKDYSPPGQVYSEVSEDFRHVFTSQTATVVGPVTDRWGTWISALVPIHDPQRTMIDLVPEGTGAIRAVLGMDIDSRNWHGMLVRAALPPGLMTLALIVLLSVGLLLLSRRSRLAPAAPPWMKQIEISLTVSVGLVLTLFAAWMAHASEFQSRSKAFADLAANQTARIAESLHDLRGTELEGLAAFYASSSFVSPEEFRQFTTYLTRNPAVSVWGWVPAVPETERSQFEEKARTQGLPGFYIWQKDARGKTVPASGRDAYYPVFYVAPLAGNENVRGYDLGSEPIRRAAMEEAIGTRLSTGTDPVMLLKETGNRKGMLIYRPVFDNDDPDRLLGFAMAVLRMETLLRSGISDIAALMELSLLRKNAAPEPLAVTWDADSPMPSGLAATRPVFAFGKVFAVTTHAGEKFMSLHPTRAGRLTILIGMALTASLAVIIRLTLHRREELEQLVAVRTLELRESEQSYRNQFANNSSVMLLIDPDDGAIIDINSAALNFYGYSHEKLLTMRISDINTLPVSEIRQIMASVPSRHGKRFQFQHRLSNGSLRDVQSSISRIQFGKRMVLHVIVQDITDYRQAEAELLREQLLMKTLLDSLPGIFYLYSYPELRLIRWNKNHETLLGFGPGEIDNRSILDWHIPEAKDAVLAAVKLVMEKGQNMIESPLLAKDGRLIPFILTGVRLSVSDRTYLMGVGIDISERKQIEEEKAKLEGRLQQAQKLESVGRLAGGVAHDFNNMLGAILGYAELAMAQVEPTQRIFFNLYEIQKAARRSADLTRQLLGFARKQTVAPHVLDLNETVTGMLSMLERLIGEDIDLTWLPSADLWPIKVDPSQIDQILANLCVNARDAIADIGKITIETENCTIGEDYCAVYTYFKPGEYVRLSVSDNGSGVDKETLPHIFEPFFTTKALGKGTGLGLATVYGIVKQNNGFINVYSEPEQGTTFRIYLPRHAGKVGPMSDEVPSEPVMRGHETILLVEDEPTLLELITLMLENLGYTVLPAATPNDAIHLAEVHAGQLHMLMTDVVMPEMNGRDLAENIMSRHADLKRLFMSGYTANVIAHHGVLDEGVHFIQKPFSQQELAAKVRETLEDNVI